MKPTKDNFGKIWAFIKKQTVLNIATSINDVPYCASCFYAFDEAKKLLVFKSKKESRHATEAYQQKNVAGTILPDKQKLGIVVGIQFQGKLIVPDKVTLSTLNGKYYKKFPYARAIAGEIMIVQLSFVKMTDSRLGFGKKISWYNNNKK